MDDLVHTTGIRPGPVTHLTVEPFMSVLTSLKDVALSPLAGKVYFNSDREWREEFIYFAMTDRFQDSANRVPPTRSGRSPGVAVPNAPRCRTGTL
jgi:hypothetical protein